MDKPSERKADTKKRDGSDKDDDYIKDFGAGGKCEYLPGLWHKPATITGGSADQRLHDRNYCKTDHEKKLKEPSLAEMIDNVLCDTGGPPFSNISRPKRVF